MENYFPHVPLPGWDEPVKREDEERKKRCDRVLENNQKKEELKKQEKIKNKKGKK